MSGIYEKVIKNTKKIEALLEEKLTAEGKGLYEKTVSVEAFVDQDIVKKIRRIATIRNKLMHEDEFELANTDSFEEDCKDVIYYLSTTEFDQSITPKPAGIKQSRNTRVCKSCGADTKPTLRVIYGGWFTKEAKRHICALCGDDMYITGGGRTLFAKIIFLAFLLQIFSTLIMVIGLSPEGGGGLLSSMMFPFAILCMGYWLWKRKQQKNKLDL